MRALLKRFDFRVSIGYSILAALWILLSDSGLNLLFSGNLPLLSTISLLKGWLFVAVTGLALFAVLRIELRKRDRMERVLHNELNVSSQTLEALQWSENRLAAMFHSSPVATSISHHQDSYLVDVNDAFVEMFGYQRDELIGRTSFEVGLWVRPEERRKLIKATFESGSVHSFEIQGRTKSGTTIDLLGSSQLIDYGDELHIVNIFFDVTERRKLQEQVRYQALLLLNVSDAIISTDIDFKILSWNPAAEKIYGWKADEVIGRQTSEFIQGEYPDTTETDIINQIQKTGTWQGEAIHQRRDGSRVHLWASTSAVHDREGRYIGLVTVNHDITEVMKAQQEKRAASQLQSELEKKTELLAMKEDFISVVSHEFRTPLTVIMSSSELLSTHYGQMPAERQLKHFQAILDQTKYMSVLINDVLTINKARAGKLDFYPALLDLMSFCNEILQHLKEVDRGKHNIVFTPGGDLSNVRADAKLLQHILINLLSNAIKYSPSGSEVHFAVARQDDEIVFRVSDQGIGIPAESLPHLYEPFYRAKNTGDIGGTGLGTAIVKESVDAHKGTISYESEVGVGTTVTVRLPVT